MLGVVLLVVLPVVAIGGYFRDKAKAKKGRRRGWLAGDGAAGAVWYADTGSSGGGHHGGG